MLVHILRIGELTMCGHAREFKVSHSKLQTQLK